MTHPAALLSPPLTPSTVVAAWRGISRDTL
jgi:hypothetical protein